MFIFHSSSCDVRKEEAAGVELNAVVPNTEPLEANAEGAGVVVVVVVLANGFLAPDEGGAALPNPNPPKDRLVEGAVVVFDAGVAKLAKDEGAGVLWPKIELAPNAVVPKLGVLPVPNTGLLSFAGSAFGAAKTGAV